jgi:hypothetical protein
MVGSADRGFLCQGGRVNYLVTNMLPPKPLSYAWHLVDGRYIKIFGDTEEDRKRVLGYLAQDKPNLESFGMGPELCKFYPGEKEDRVMFLPENMEMANRFIMFFLNRKQ